MSSPTASARSEPVASDHSIGSRRRSLVVVIISMAGMAMFYGYSGPLLSIVLEDQGVAGWLIGLNGSVQMLGVIVALPFLPRLIRALGPARVMAIGASVALASILLMGAFANVAAWFPLRLMLGAAQSLMWTTGETWINHASDDRSRGRTVSFFISAIATGFAIGPFVQAEIGSQGWTPFLIGAVMMGALTLPLFAAMADRISAGGTPSIRLSQYVPVAPVPMFSNLFFAMIASALMTLLAVYGLRLHMDEGSAARMIGWMGWGGVLVPLVIGYLADRVNRTLLLAFFIAFGALAAAGMPLLADMGVVTAAIYLMIFGGLRAGHYGLSVMLLGEKFRGAELPTATAIFGFMFGIGSFMGPAISGVAIDMWNPHGLPLVVALFYLAFLPLPIIAYLRRGRVVPGTAS